MKQVLSDARYLRTVTNALELEPAVAEVAFVGKAPNKYQIYLGGNEPSTRLNRIYKESVKTDDLIAELRLILQRYLSEKSQGERVGDFCARVLWNETPAQTAV